MKIVAVGDNVVDCYLDQKLIYPGGNAVNVAVNCKRNGSSVSSYIGVFADDEMSAHIQWALRQEGIDFGRSRYMMGHSGQPRVTLTKDGDRVFVGGPHNTVQRMVRLRFIEDDLKFIAKHDVCHTSCFSFLEEELPAISKHCPVSFDFSEYRGKDYLERVCPHVKFAFFSGSDLSPSEIRELMEFAAGLGTEVIGVTLGDKGSVFWEKGIIYEGVVKPAEVVDTMGAGDSFIAGFLTKYLTGANMTDALDYAATCAAKTCGFYGGFGYPAPFKENNLFMP